MLLCGVGGVVSAASVCGRRSCTRRVNRAQSSAAWASSTACAFSKAFNPAFSSFCPFFPFLFLVPREELTRISKPDAGPGEPAGRTGRQRRCAPLIVAVSASDSARALHRFLRTLAITVWTAERAAAPLAGGPGLVAAQAGRGGASHTEGSAPVPARAIFCASLLPCAFTFMHVLWAGRRGLPRHLRCCCAARSSPSPRWTAALRRFAHRSKKSLLAWSTRMPRPRRLPRYTHVSVNNVFARLSWHAQATGAREGGAPGGGIGCILVEKQNKEGGAPKIQPVTVACGVVLRVSHMLCAHAGRYGCCGSRGQGRAQRHGDDASGIDPRIQAHL